MNDVFFLISLCLLGFDRDLRRSTGREWASNRGTMIYVGTGYKVLPKIRWEMFWAC
jgi:hypothetical protein